ncbi:MAG TPA: lipoyl synthase [Chloroflexia bacterium]|nr:lipoyl synthase [Chloroflexia bacterium]
MEKRTIDLMEKRGYHRAIPKPEVVWREPKPSWLKTKLPNDPNYFELKKIMRDRGLHTVCEEANCPNITECWTHRTATFLILGDICTRACGYCDVTSGKPLALDPLEARKVVEATKAMGLQHVVITSVNRDDLEDGGAPVFAEIVNLLREEMPECRTELLIPDFCGRWESLETVMDSRPDILNYNTETVPSLYKRVRHKARYERTLELLQRAKNLGRHYNVVTKSGIMVGLGETKEELVEVMKDLRSVECDVMTLGQYMRPSPKHLKVERYYTPEEFRELQEIGLSLGFSHVESGPLVRSSYHAHQQVPAR